MQDELDIKIFFRILFNNKKLIIFFSIFSLLAGSLISFIPKKIYKGEIEFIKNNFIQDNPLYNKNMTENAICLDINDDYSSFEIMKSRKIMKNLPLGSSDLDGRNNFEVRFIPGTKVINIEFKHNNKNLIREVLKKWPVVYEEYVQKEYYECLERKKEFALGKLITIQKDFESSKNNLLETAVKKNLSFIYSNKKGGEENLLTLSEKDISNLNPEDFFKINFLLKNYTFSEKNLIETKSRIFFIDNLLLFNDLDSIELIKDVNVSKNHVYPERIKISFLAFIIGFFTIIFIVLSKYKIRN